MRVESKRLYRLYELEEMLAVHRNTLYNWIQLGVCVTEEGWRGRKIRHRVYLEARRTGHDYRVEGRELIRFLRATGKEDDLEAA